MMSKAILQLNRLLVEVVDDPMSIRRVKEKLAEQLSEGYSLFRQMNRELLEGLVYDWELVECISSVRGLWLDFCICSIYGT